MQATIFTFLTFFDLPKSQNFATLELYLWDARPPISPKNLQKFIKF